MRRPIDPAVPSGFDYARAILDLRGHKTYEEIAEWMGYADPSGVSSIVNGQIPNHIAGQALWALYVGTLGRKPPMTAAQALGTLAADLDKTQQHFASTA